MRTESQLIQAIASADSLAEQASLVSELDALKASRARTASLDGEIDLGSTIVEATLTPVSVHTMHTAATDWLDDVTMTTEADLKTATNAMSAEASLWFARTSADVRADREEFAEQARGMARRLAGKYGEGAPAAAQAFLDYADFLHRREAASGLDQVQQLVDGNNQNKRTPLPADTFDTFNQEVDPMNAGVDEMQSSQNAPLLNEILSNPGFPGAGQPENPGGHQTSQPGIEQNGPMMGAQGSLVDSPSLAMGYVANLDDFRRQAAAEAAQEPRPFSVEAATSDPTGQMYEKATGKVWDDEKRPNCSVGGCERKAQTPGEDWSERMCDLHTRISGNKAAQGDKYRGPGMDIHLTDKSYGKHGAATQVADDDDDADDINEHMKSQHGDHNNTYYHDTRSVGEHPSTFNEHMKSQHGDHSVRDIDSHMKSHHSNRVVVSRVVAGGTCENCTNGNHSGTNGTPGCKGKPCACTGQNCGKQPRPEKTAASGLPQVQQQTDVHDQVAPTPMPQDVMFPLVGPFAGEMNTNGTGEAMPAEPLNGQGTGPQRQGAIIDAFKPVEGEDGDEDDQAKSPFAGNSKIPKEWYEASLNKTADEFSAPAGNVGSANPLMGETFNGSEGSVEEPTNAMQKALKHGVRKTAKEGSPEFRKGFGFAANWQPTQPLVKKGSAEFEAGLFAGMRENTERAQEAWISRHEARGGAFARRIATARKYAASNNRGFHVGEDGKKRYCDGCSLPSHKPVSEDDGVANGKSEHKHAGTTTDLDTMVPGASPDAGGNTPLNGPGSTPPLAGGMDAAAPGGASPYNGADPYGSPVAPDPLLPISGRPMASDNGGMAMAFRQRVQAGVLAQAQS